MARALEQEVNLSRRACWKHLEVENNDRDNIERKLKRNIINRNECYVCIYF
jgi:hypothetical protein